jgi:hypothetical protein
LQQWQHPSLAWQQLQKLQQQKHPTKMEAYTNENPYGGDDQLFNKPH